MSFTVAHPEAHPLHLMEKETRGFWTPNLHLLSFAWALRITTKFCSRLNNSEGTLAVSLESPFSTPSHRSLYDTSSMKE